MTNKKKGGLKDLNEEERGYFKNFTDCLFKKFKSLDDCRCLFDDIIRAEYRKEDSVLSNIY